jgi:beta-phosphoglucomutase
MAEVKAVVFDMDGVLIDARDWHYEALNEALALFDAEIDRQDHLRRFDGLPTRKKLEMLSAEGRLPRHVHDTIDKVKQDRTLRIAARNLFPRLPHQIMLGWIRARGLGLGVATNSIRQTSEYMLDLAKVLPYLDVLVTNEDVDQAKPHPDIYLFASKALGVHPSEMLVIEDSKFGVESATTAGCRVLRVESPEDVNLGLIKQALREVDRA